MLILKTLARAGRQHGFEIAEHIRQVSQDVLRVEEGSLYPALQRMLVRGGLTGGGGRTGRERRPPARLCRKRPRLAAVGVLARALGIGPNAAIFSVMNAVVLRYLPVPQPQRLVYLRSTGQPDGMSNTGDSRLSFSYQVFAR